MAFDIRDVLGTVSKSDPGQEQIIYIALDKLDPDPSNFYTLDGIEDLKKDISEKWGGFKAVTDFAFTRRLWQKA